jgi:hypothetical protein
MLGVWLERLKAQAPVPAIGRFVSRTGSARWTTTNGHRYLLSFYIAPLAALPPLTRIFVSISQGYREVWRCGNDTLQTEGRRDGESTNTVRVNQLSITLAACNPWSTLLTTSSSSTLTKRRMMKATCASSPPPVQRPRTNHLAFRSVRIKEVRGSGRLLSYCA